jgi:diguanylate cyclase (GGDEF)-like protein
LGHVAGDDLLRQVAGRLGGCLRPDDLLARLGGDEFVIVLPQVSDLDAVTRIGHRVLEALTEPFQLGAEMVRIAASVGGVVGERGSGRSADQANDLLRDADAAMYEAKDRGRGRVEVFDRFTAQKAVDRLSLREDLLTALDRGELELHYQPIVDLTDGRVTGFEALLRWHHHRLGPIPPLDFIPVAEETGAIGSIGDWALTQACRQLARWNQDAVRPLSMAVNVSPIQLLDPAFVRKSVRTIQQAGLRNEQVWLEVTESIEVTDQLSDQLRLLRKAGVRVAMDDFGMSYSNLGYLKHLQVERLKIDRSFVAGLSSGPAGSDGMDRGIVRAILAIAESAGMSVVAEGIETEDQRQVLLGLGCRQGQGYLFARPMPAAEASRLLLDGAPIPAPRLGAEVAPRAQ